MWSDRRLCALLGLEHPIIQAPMAGSATPALAAAVSNAGALGSLGCGEMQLAALNEAVEALRAASNRPFNLNFFVYPAPRTPPETLASLRRRLAPWYAALGRGSVPDALPTRACGFPAEKLEALLALRPAVASFHFGVPPAADLRRIQAAGIRVLSTATTVAEARELEAAGVDAIIAQGWEAGGHRGSHSPREPSDGIGTLALVPQVVDAVRVPVIAAGGIADGRGVAACLALGASGVQLGTAFLSCPEAGTDATRRALIRAAADSDTMMTDAFSGRAARARRSRYALDMERQRQSPAAFPTHYALSDPLLQAGRDEEASFHLYGQAAALNRELPAARLVETLAAEAQETLRRLAR